MNFGLFLDVLMSILLVITIAYAALLNGRLRNLRAGRAELEAAIGEFTRASADAGKSIEMLKRDAGAGQADFDERMASARKLTDELAFLVDRAEEQAARLERVIREGRPLNMLKDPAPVRDNVRPHPASEQALLKKLVGLG